MTTYSLAQIIQGEASTAEGQFAVASTILNRSKSPLFGSADPLTIANQPGQFTGHLTGPGGPGAVPTSVSPFAQQLADALQGGSLSNFGNPGNALFFQSNQGQPSTVVGGSSAFIGGNYFTDRQGQPSPNFQPPVFGGGSVYDPNSGMFDGNSGLGHSSDALSTQGGAGATSTTDYITSNDPFNQVGGTQSPTDLGGLAKPVLGGDTGIPGVSSSGSGTFNDTTLSPSATSDKNPILPNAPAGSGASAGTAPTVNDPASGGGTPITQTNAAQIGADAGNTISKAVGGATSGLASDTTSIEAAGTGWLGNIFTGGTSLLVRGGLITLGLVVLMGAFVFFYVDSQTRKAA